MYLGWHIGALVGRVSRYNTIEIVQMCWSIHVGRQVVNLWGKLGTSGMAL